jgi:hypothetical protein
MKINLMHLTLEVVIETKLSKESALLSCFPANGMKQKVAALHFEQFSPLFFFVKKHSPLPN